MSSSIVVRAFHRGDREQLTRLVNIHAAAVMPGASVSVNTVLNQLEREPAEFIVDPWVAERQTLVAEQREQLVAAAHLLRYASDERVNPHMRDLGEIHWLLFWPDSRDAAEDLMRACLAVLERWRVTLQGADGSLPVPGVYGVPEQWPHVQALYAGAGFAHTGHTEVVLLANVANLPVVAPPVPGLQVRRSVGSNGTRLSAVLGEECPGYIEVESREEPGRMPRHAGLADIGNLCVAKPWRRQRIGTWLVAQAAEWLRLGHFDRLLHYAYSEEEAQLAFARSVGFREITRTQRGWRRALLK